MFGTEDRDIIAPAVTPAQAEGIAATGHGPGDTVFMRARRANSTSWWRSITTRG